jgi:hypothetical protein
VDWKEGIKMEIIKNIKYDDVNYLIKYTYSQEKNINGVRHNILSILKTIDLIDEYDIEDEAGTILTWDDTYENRESIIDKTIDLIHNYIKILNSAQDVQIVDFENWNGDMLTREIFKSV